MSNKSELAWNKVDWKKIESRVFRIQRRIYKAKTEKKVNVVYYLQKKIINSLDGKLLSIREAIKIQKSCGIKTLYFHNRKKSINLVCTLKIKNNQSKDNNYRNKVNKSILLSSFDEKKHLLKDHGAQFIIKLALEPEWAPVFEINSMGHQLGQNYQDTIKTILSTKDMNIKYTFHSKLFELSKSFDKKNFLKKLNTIKIIEGQIKKWLHFNLTLHFEKRKTNFYSDSDFEKTQINPIVPFLCDIALSGLETYLTNFINTQIRKPRVNNRIQYFRYLNEVLILSENKQVLTEIILIGNQYLKSLGIQFDKNSNLSKNMEAISFLGFQFNIVKPKNEFNKRIRIAKDSKNLLLSKTRFIIQKNKSATSYYLIVRLSSVLLSWGMYFQYCDCKKTFLQIDNRILNQLRAWVFRRKAQGKNRSFLKEKYFPSEQNFSYQGSKHKNSWVLCGELKTVIKQCTNYLPKLYWIEQKKYLSVKNICSIYDGDYSYWHKRLFNHNMHIEQRFLLRKKFLFENKIEIYNLFTTLKIKTFNIKNTSD